MSERILVLGGGGIGGLVAGLLSESGSHDVLLADQWPENIEQIRSDGLLIDVRGQSSRTVPVRAIHLHELQRESEPFDAVFVAVKSYDTDWTAALARRHLAEGGVAMSTQNGLNDERVAAAVGLGRTLGVVVTVAGELLGAGHALRADAYEVGFKVGELDGPVTDRVRHVADLLGEVAVTKTTGNLVGERWAKLATNTMVNAMSGLSGYGAGEVRSMDDTLPVLILLGAETVRVGLASGHDVEPVMGLDPGRFVAAADGVGREELIADIRVVARATGGHRASMLQDVLKGRRTEIEDLNGEVARRGAALGIETPFNLEAARIVRRHAIGALRPDPENIAPMIEMARQRWS
ncbi:MAG: 2-dehydropantoate 2-reductase [Nocardioides sp.]